MDWALVLQRDALPQVLAIAGMLALAGILLRLDFNNRANRAFALFLGVRGFSMALVLLRDLPNYQCSLDPSHPACDLDAVRYLGDVIPYLIISVPFIFAYFVSVYPRARGPFAPWPRGATLLLAPLVVLELAYGLRHELWMTRTVTAPGYLVETDHGALVALQGIMYLSFGILAWILAGDYIKEPPGARRRSLFAMTLGFTVNALYDATGTLTVILRSPETATSAQWITALGFVPIAAAIGRLLVFAFRFADGEVRGSVIRFLIVLPLPIASALASVVFPDLKTLNLITTGLWRLALPVLVTYALVRHQLFDIDLKIKWTLQKSSLASVFGVAYFVGGELLEKLIPVNGTILGVAAAGTVALALRPLDRLTHQIADRIMPGIKPMGNLSRYERTHLYREQARIAWEDGTMRQKERLLLNALRDRLQLSADEASRIESEIMPA